MPTVYERVVNGHVVERVQPVPDDYEDTRLGVAVLDGNTAGWRIARQDTSADITSDISAETIESTQVTPLTGQDKTEDNPSSQPAAPAKSRKEN